MQHCDSTCFHCAQTFFLWWKQRVKNQDRVAGGRSGDGSFNVAAASSVGTRRETLELDRAVNDDVVDVAG